MENNTHLLQQKQNWSGEYIIILGNDLRRWEGPSGVSLWCCISSTQALESVQVFAYNLKRWDMDYEGMLQQLELASLSQRRKVFKLITVYNIIYIFPPVTLYEIIFPIPVVNYIRPFTRTICIHRLSHPLSLRGTTYLTVLELLVSLYWHQRKGSRLDLQIVGLFTCFLNAQEWFTITEFRHAVTGFITKYIAGTLPWHGEHKLGSVAIHWHHSNENNTRTYHAHDQLTKLQASLLSTAWNTLFRCKEGQVITLLIWTQEVPSSELPELDWL